MDEAASSERHGGVEDAACLVDEVDRVAGEHLSALGVCGDEAADEDLLFGVARQHHAGGGIARADESGTIEAEAASRAEDVGRCEELGRCLRRCAADLVVANEQM